jgi:hypothetical protein
MSIRIHLAGRSIPGCKFFYPAGFMVLAALWCLCGCSLADYSYLTNGASNASGGVAGQANDATGGDTRSDSTANGGTLSGGAPTTDVGGTAVQGGAGGTTAGGSTSGGSAAGGTASGGKTITSGGNDSGGATSMTIGAAGASTNATGVAVLTVPLTTASQGKRFNWQDYNYQGRTPNYYDLTGATLNIVACAPGATGGDLNIFFTTNYGNSPTFKVPLSAITSGFQTVSIPVPGATSTGYDPATILVTRIEVEAESAFGTSWETPATIVYIDRISTSNGLFNDTFDSPADPGTLQGSGARPLTGSTLTWLSSFTVPPGTGGTTSTGQGGGAGNGGTYAGSGTARSSTDGGAGGGGGTSGI